MKSALMIAALIGAVVLAYRNTHSGSFIYDDKHIIVKNPLVREPRPLHEHLTTPYWGKQNFIGQFRPFLIYSHALVGGV